MKTAISALTAALLVTALAPELHAQENSGGIPSLQNLRLSHLTTDDGLSHDNVLAIIQDRRGFMWFATRNGLDRYDGTSFVAYKNNPDDEQTISDNFIQDLMEDDRGYLWIGTNSGGVDRFDPVTESFIHFQFDRDDENSLSDNSVESVFQDSRGLYWFGTGSKGLNLYEPVSGTFTRYASDSGGRPIGRVTCIAEGIHGNIWFTGRNGLYCLDRETGRIAQPLNPKGIYPSDFIRSDESGNLWMLSWSPEALVKYNPETSELAEYPLDGMGLFSCNMIGDGQEGFWIPSRRGLFHFDRESGRFDRKLRNDETDPYSLNDNNVASLFRDREGLLWLGTENGGLNIVNFRQEQFGYYRHKPGDPYSIPAGRITAVHSDSDGVLWLGSSPRILTRFDRGNGTATRFRPVPGDVNSLSDGFNIGSIIRSSDGYIWLGGWGGGLVRFDEENGSFRTFLPDPADPGSLISDAVLEIREDRDGTLWIGQFGGLSHFDPRTEKFANYFHDPENPLSLGSSSIKRIYRDRSGILWIGTWEGVLSRFYESTQTFHNYNPEKGVPGKLNGGGIYVITESRSGVMWIGAADGLYRFDRSGGSFTRYTENQGLPSNSVQGILEDDAGALWISTTNGLSRFDPLAGSFRNFTAFDGLQSNDFSQSCYGKGENGEMLFGGSNGFNAFFPGNIGINTTPPPVVLTHIKIYNESVPIGPGSLLEKSLFSTESLSLPYDDKVFSFYFAALSYADPGENRFRYRLEGLESDWNEVSSRQNFTTYTNLDPGDYTFQVIASNNDGLWNETGTALDITIIPPWWMTWEFRITAGVLLAALAAILYRSRTNRLRKYNRRLHRDVDIRTGELAESNRQLQISRDRAEIANRAKSTFLANMSHELRTPLNAILGYSEILGKRSMTDPMRKGLHIIHQSGEHLLSLINDVLDLAKVEAGKMELNPVPCNLPAFLRGTLDIIRTKTDSRSLALLFEELTPLPDRVLTDDIRLRQVLLNLLNNAAKFSDRGEITLRAGYVDPGRGDDLIRYEVEDTGIGIPPEQLSRIFLPFEQISGRERQSEGTGIGLSVSRQIVRMMGGVLQVRSEPGKGSAFWFDIVQPVAGSHVPDDFRKADEIIGYEEPRRRILIAEDRECNRAVLTEMLEPLGFEIRTACNGREAVAEARSWRPDAVLMDLVMPVETGFEAAAEIRRIPGQEKTLIVAVSAGVLDTDEEKSLIAGCDAFLPKPVRTDRLLELIGDRLKLEWIYKEQKRDKMIDCRDMHVPPPEKMWELYELARIGALSRINREICYLAEENEKYEPFVRKMRELSGNFRIDEIKVLLEQYHEIQKEGE